MSALIICTALVFVGLIVYKWLKPKPIPGIPLLAGLSTARRFTENPATLLREAHKTLGNVFTIDLSLLRMTISFNNEDVQKFFRVQESEMSIQSSKRFVEVIVGPDAFKTTGMPDNHKYITEGFIRAERLQAYLEKVRAETKKQLLRLAAMDSFDLFPEISRIVVLANTLCILGEECYKEHGEEFAKAYYEIEMNAFKPAVLIAPWFPSPSIRKVKAARKKLLNIISGEIRKRLADLPRYENNFDYLQLQINMALKDGFSPDNFPRWFSTGAVSLLFAAHTNTAGTFAWSLAHIGDNAEFQKRARAECEGSIDAEKGWNYNTLARLSFLDCLMKETVRSYALLFITRRTIVPSEFGGVTIPAEEIVAISPYLTHHDPNIYKDPETFNPDRFANGAAMKHIEDKTYMQFGFGPHRCLGEKFANVVLKTGWTECLTNYSVELLSPLTGPDFSRAIGMPWCSGSIRARITPLK